MCLPRCTALDEPNNIEGEVSDDQRSELFEIFVLHTWFMRRLISSRGYLSWYPKCSCEIRHYIILLYIMRLYTIILQYYNRNVVRITN